MSDSVRNTLERNLKLVHERIANAARRSGRRAEDITLVAITKYVDISIVKELVSLGQRTLGESRPQQLWERAEVLREKGVEWHLVGPLQKNKVRKTLPVADWIHSIDSVALLEAVDRIAGELGLCPKVLLEVNVSGHPAKHGFHPEEMHQVVERALLCKNVVISGLMAMAGYEGDMEGARRDFRTLRILQDELQQSLGTQNVLKELSMGMSGDFEIAIEEGATMVRVGSAIFEGLPEVHS